MFSQPMISCDSAVRRLPYRGCTLTTFEASRLTVLQITAPQLSSNALPMTFAFVPGGPEAMTKGFGTFKPLTVVLRSAMVLNDVSSKCLDVKAYRRLHVG